MAGGACYPGGRAQGGGARAEGAGPRRFGATVCQALAFGAPVSDALLAQSREIREANRAEIERAIERAPVKILIPTGTLILPALLLAILGPLLSASGMM